MPQISFELFCAREIKGFYQSSLGNDVDFRDIMNVSRNFEKLRHFFLDERTMITMTSISSFTGKPLYLFSGERKDMETHFNTNSELSQNRTEKQIMRFKAKVSIMLYDV